MKTDSKLTFVPPVLGPNTPQYSNIPGSQQSSALKDVSENNPLDTTRGEELSRKIDSEANNLPRVAGRLINQLFNKFNFLKKTEDKETEQQQKAEKKTAEETIKDAEEEIARIMKNKTKYKKMFSDEEVARLLELVSATVQLYIMKNRTQDALAWVQNIMKIGDENQVSTEGVMYPLYCLKISLNIELKSYGVARSDLNFLKMAYSETAQKDPKIFYYEALSTIGSSTGLSLPSMANVRQKVMDLLNRALELASDDAPCYLQRGVVFANSGQNQEAFNDFTKAIELGLKDSQTFYQRAMVAKNLGRHKESVADFTKAITLGLQNSQTFYQRALVLESLGEDQLAIDDFIKVINSDPKNYQAYGKAINLLIKNGGKDRAVELLLKRGVINKDKSIDKSPALDDFSRVIELDPLNHQAYNYRGELLHSLGRTQEAIDDFTKLTELQPDDYRNFYKRGLFYKGIDGGDKKAIADFTQALALNPGNPDIIFARATSIGSSDFRSAIEDIKAIENPTPQMQETLSEYERQWDELNADAATAFKVIGGIVAAVALPIFSYLYYTRDQRNNLDLNPVMRDREELDRALTFYFKSAIEMTVDFENVEDRRLLNEFFNSLIPVINGTPNRDNLDRVFQEILHSDPNGFVDFINNEVRMVFGDQRDGDVDQLVENIFSPIKAMFDQMRSSEFRYQAMDNFFVNDPNYRISLQNLVEAIGENWEVRYGEIFNRGFLLALNNIYTNVMMPEEPIVEAPQQAVGPVGSSVLVNNPNQVGRGE
ncbi:MAG: tetratricopeptide repeat protein [Pseudomonadota bacterium]